MNYKKHFPIFKHRPDLIFFDSAASSQKLDVVLDAIKYYYENSYSNIHRGPNFLSEESTLAYENARKSLSKFIESKFKHEIIFTRNATESINLVARTFGESLNEGDEVLLRKMEHHANIVPWLQLKERKGILIKYIDITSDGFFQLDESIITPKTKLVSITGMSNVMGSITDIKPIINLAHKVGAKVLIDACQLATHKQIDVQDLDCDFLVFSGHKLYGPTGIGILYGKSELLKSMIPFLGGGDMINEVFEDHFTTNDVPNKFEAGTPNIAGAIGFSAAIKFIEEIGFNKIQKYEEELTSYIISKFNKMSFIKIIGPQNSNNRGSVVSFKLDGVHPHDIAEGLSQKGICIRAGHHCCQILMDKFQLPGTARISLGIYNTVDEIDKTCEVLEEIYNYFK